MDRGDVLDLLRARIRQAGSQKAFSRQSGVSNGYINDVLAQRAAPGEKLLRALGLRRVVTYEPLKETRK